MCIDQIRCVVFLEHVFADCLSRQLKRNLHYIIISFYDNSASTIAFLIGIGDRHLENLLIDVTTGSVIQIDFGICFGMGSSVLQVSVIVIFFLILGIVRSIT